VFLLPTCAIMPEREVAQPAAMVCQGCEAELNTAGTLVSVSKTFVGSRVRQLRSERGFNQAALAQMLEISPSYLNQIEHDVRPLTVAVLLRITEVFGVDATFFASQDDTRLTAELREVTLDRDLGIDVDMAEIADVVSAHPALAKAMVNLHRRYRLTSAQLAAATEDRFHDHAVGSGSGSIAMPHEEVRDYFYQRQNYLHELDTAAEDLTVRMRMHRGELARDLTQRLTQVHGVRVVRRDVGPNVLHRYDTATKTLEMSSHLSGGQQVFKLAAELAYLEFGDLIDALVTEGNFTSDDARTLARLGLANYFAAAAVLPYRQFHDVSEKFRYDVERLSAYYSVSYETVAHRLSTLQRPSMRGVPFSFVRVDRAGNMSKRQSATGFHFSSAGGTCPLWNVYETFANPGKIGVQIAQMPDGRHYMWVARTVERRASRYGQPGKTFAIGLGCELRHAHRLVYSEGLDLTGDNAIPIGAGCRVCERDNCPQRAFPAFGRTLDLDEHRSTVSPYLVKE
jgi:XRE family transcriptional regulator, fatty acid utilization regulator